MKKEIPMVYRFRWGDWCVADTDRDILFLCRAELEELFNMDEIPPPANGNRLTAVASTIRPTDDDNYYEVVAFENRPSDVSVAAPYGIYRRIDTYSTPRQIIDRMVPPGYPVFFWLEYGGEE